MTQTHELARPGRVYTQQRYVLGYRCDQGHGGNRRYVLGVHFGRCQGCGHFAAAADLTYSSRAEALAADRALAREAR